MISLLISLIILCIVFGLLWWVVSLLPLPAPFGQIALVLMVLVFILVLLGYVLPYAGLRPLGGFR